MASQITVPLAHADELYALRSNIDARVASGHYGNTSEYIRGLIE